MIGAATLNASVNLVLSCAMVLYSDVLWVAQTSNRGGLLALRLAAVPCMEAEVTHSACAPASLNAW